MQRSKSDARLPVTRRAFLHGLAALGGHGALSVGMQSMGLLGSMPAMAADRRETTEALPPGSLGGKRVVVIGAGVAGLCAALRLSRAGADVVILEATERAGGRNLTLRHGDRFSEHNWNEPTEMRFETVGDIAADDPRNYLNVGPGRIPQHHSRVIDYCRELGVILEPFIFHDAANLLQNDAWNKGRPVQLRRVQNDLRGHLAEMLAKVQSKGALDQILPDAEAEAFLGMLQHFGQLSAEGADLVYRGASMTEDYPRAGYEIDRLTGRQLNPGSVASPGAPWQTLSLNEVLESDFWQSEMFNNLEYFWQAALLQPQGGMDKIVEGFLNAEIPGKGTLRNLIRSGSAVESVSRDGNNVVVQTIGGGRFETDFVVATLAPSLLADLKGDLIPEEARDLLAKIHVTPACKVGWQAKSRFWEDEDHIYGGISWTRHSISQMWYPSQGVNGPTGIITGAYNDGEVAAAFQELSRTQRLQSALAGGERLHAGFAEKVFVGNGVSIAWAKMPYQTGGWADETVFTQAELFKQVSTLSPVDSQVFFAGDWFSYWPGWQEGALDSAHHATDGIHTLVASGR